MASTEFIIIYAALIIAAFAGFQLSQRLERSDKVPSAKARAAYRAHAIKQVNLPLHKEKDEDIIAFLYAGGSPLNATRVAVRAYLESEAACNGEEKQP